jgi:hypothetical protein
MQKPAEGPVVPAVGPAFRRLLSSDRRDARPTGSDSITGLVYESRQLQVSVVVRRAPRWKKKPDLSLILRPARSRSMVIPSLWPR